MGRNLRSGNWLLASVLVAATVTFGVWLRSSALPGVGVGIAGLLVYILIRSRTVTFAASRSVVPSRVKVGNEAREILEHVNGASRRANYRSILGKYEPNQVRLAQADEDVVTLAGGVLKRHSAWTSAPIELASGLAQDEHTHLTLSGAHAYVALTGGSLLRFDSRQQAPPAKYPNKLGSIDELVPDGLGGVYFLADDELGSHVINWKGGSIKTVSAPLKPRPFELTMIGGKVAAVANEAVGASILTFDRSLATTRSRTLPSGQRWSSVARAAGSLVGVSGTSLLNCRLSNNRPCRPAELGSGDWGRPEVVGGFAYVASTSGDGRSGIGRTEVQTNAITHRSSVTPLPASICCATTRVYRRLEPDRGLFEFSKRDSFSQRGEDEPGHSPPSEFTPSRMFGVEHRRVPHFPDAAFDMRPGCFEQLTRLRMPTANVDHLASSAGQLRQFAAVHTQHHRRSRHRARHRLEVGAAVGAPRGIEQVECLGDDTVAVGHPREQCDAERLMLAGPPRARGGSGAEAEREPTVADRLHRRGRCGQRAGRAVEHVGDH